MIKIINTYILPTILYSLLFTIAVSMNTVFYYIILLLTILAQHYFFKNKLKNIFNIITCILFRICFVFIMLASGIFTAMFDIINPEYGSIGAGTGFGILIYLFLSNIFFLITLSFNNGAK